jgi:hypothetical protein
LKIVRERYKEAKFELQISRQLKEGRKRSYKCCQSIVGSGE